MKWICKVCETENDGELLRCEVCDSPAPRTLDTVDVTGEVFPSFITEEALWGEALRINTIKAYEQYLQKTIARKHIEEAKRIISDYKKWETANSVNSRKAYEDYLKCFPNGVRANIARERLNRFKTQKHIRREYIIASLFSLLIAAGFFIPFMVETGLIEGHSSTRYKTESHEMEFLPSSPKVHIEGLEKEMERKLNGLEVAKKYDEINPKVLQEVQELLPQLKESDNYDNYKKRISFLSQQDEL